MARPDGDTVEEVSVLAGRTVELDAAALPPATLSPAASPHPFSPPGRALLTQPPHPHPAHGGTGLLLLPITWLWSQI